MESLAQSRVLYCTVDWLGLGEQEPSNDCIIFQDALNEYHFYYDFSQGGGEYLAKFKAPRGTSVSDFVKLHFQDAVMGAKHKLSMQWMQASRSSCITVCCFLRMNIQVYSIVLAICSYHSSYFVLCT